MRSLILRWLWIEIEDGNTEADFLPVVAWRKLAEVCAEHLGKGSLVAVDGKIQVRSYEKDDERRWVTEIVAERVKFLSKKNSDKE